MENSNSPGVERVVTDAADLNGLSVYLKETGETFPPPHTLAKFSLFLVRTKGFVPFFL